MPALKYSRQREAIKCFLMTRKDHPTADVAVSYTHLNETLSKLDQSFFLCHKSCLVNTAHIRTLYRRPCQIVLDNGAVCPCAQRRFSQLQHLMGIE